MFGVFFILSCNDRSQLKQDIQQSWVVDELIDIQTNERIPLGLNLFTIDEDGSCTLPALLFEKRSGAKWNLSSKKNGNVLFLIKCESNSMFTGTYVLSFETRIGMNKLTLRSSTIQMTCRTLN